MQASGRGLMAEVAAIGTIQIEAGGAICAVDGRGSVITA